MLLNSLHAGKLCILLSSANFFNINFFFFFTKFAAVARKELGEVLNKSKLKKGRRQRSEIDTVLSCV